MANAGPNGNGASSAAPAGTPPGDGQPGSGQPAGAPPTAPIAINLQYVKDLSFEVPGAPDVFLNQPPQPQISTKLDVNARQLRDNLFEVSLLIELTAAAGDKTVFAVELDYRGIFTLTGVPNDMMELVLLVECPRQLFPFARAVVADATREGGFMPLMMPLIDFFQLYQQRRAEQGQPPVAPPGATV